MHDLQLILTTSLESAGVVENITIMVIENEFVIDIVEATLQPISSRSPSTVVNEYMTVEPQLKGQVEPGWAMRSRVPLLVGARTYLRALSLRIKPVDLGALSCVADSL